MQHFFRKLIFTNQNDLPLDQGPASRLIPWVSGVMIYLITLLLTAVIMIKESVKEWDQYFSSRLTIEIPTIGQDFEIEEKKNQLIEKVVTLLDKKIPLVSYKIVESERIQSLLEPWLGQGNIIEELPIPLLIDVKTLPHQQIDFESLTKEIEELAPGTTIEDHEQWRHLLMHLVKSLTFLGYGLTGIIIIALLSILTFVTTTELKIHHKIIEILQVVGASNKYIAKQFQSHALWIGLQGMVIGVGLLTITFLAIIAVVHRVQLPLIQDIPLTYSMLLPFFIVPLILILSMMITARLNVMQTLQKLLLK